MKTRPLQRVLGAWTTLLIGMGVAIGSGIFRTPGIVAAHLTTPTQVILVWMAAGLIVLMQGMVTAELATRFPAAGGEYVFLRQAYGDFVAFFFGWAYTVFIIGVGAAIIAIGLGDFASALGGLNPQRWSGPIAATALIAVTALNCTGIRVGALAQNVLTLIKIVTLLAVAFIALFASPFQAPAIQQPPLPAPTLGFGSIGIFLIALVPALWPYEGTTDSAKMAEEIKDVRRSIPFGLIGSALAMTAIYVLVNIAVLRQVPLAEISAQELVVSSAIERVMGPMGRNAVLVVAIIACLGSLISTTLACIRVTFALARDGLAFEKLSTMSKRQAPIPALIVVCGMGVVLVLNRDFEAALDIYFFSAAILFGLSYASLILFRIRETSFPSHVYRCPLGIVQAGVLIVIQLSLALNIALHTHRDALYAGGVLILIIILYPLWKRLVRHAER